MSMAKNYRKTLVIVTYNQSIAKMADLIGVIIGLPAGVGVLQWLLAALAGEYEMKLMLGALTYSVFILLTFGVSLLVGWMVAGKNKRTDIAEALKRTE